MDIVDEETPMPAKAKSNTKPVETMDIVDEETPMPAKAENIITPDLLEKILYRSLVHEIAYGYDCKSVSVYPITPADFSDPALKEILSLCFTYGTRVTPTSLRKNETSYLEMSFRKEEDVEGAKEKLRSWRSGLKIHGNTMERHNFGQAGNGMKEMCGDQSRILHPADRFVCVAGTPPSMSSTKLLELLPGYSATIGKDKDNELSGLCYVEFETKEAATSAVEEVQSKLVFDGVQMFAFTVNYAPRDKKTRAEFESEPAYICTKRRIKQLLSESLELRIHLAKIWFTESIPVLRKLIKEIAEAEKPVTDDAEIRKKNHLPYPDIWLNYLTEEMEKKWDQNPHLKSFKSGIRHLSAYTVEVLEVKLFRRETKEPKIRKGIEAALEAKLAYRKSYKQKINKSDNGMFVSSGPAKKAANHNSFFKKQAVKRQLANRGRGKIGQITYGNRGRGKSRGKAYVNRGRGQTVKSNTYGSSRHGQIKYNTYGNTDRGRSRHSTSGHSECEDDDVRRQSYKQRHGLGRADISTYRDSSIVGVHGEIPNQGYGQNRGRSPPSNRDDRHKYYDEPQSPHPRATHYRGDPGLDVPAVSSTAVNVLMELSQVLRKNTLAPPFNPRDAFPDAPSSAGYSNPRRNAPDERTPPFNPRGAFSDTPAGAQYSNPRGREEYLGDNLAMPGNYIRDYTRDNVAGTSSAPSAHNRGIYNSYNDKYGPRRDGR